MTASETFGDRVSRLIAEAKMSSSELASVLGVSENTARRVMDGTTQTLKLDAALRLCRRLGISPWDLAGEVAPSDAPDTEKLAATADHGSQVLQILRGMNPEAEAAVLRLFAEYAAISSGPAGQKRLAVMVDVARSIAAADPGALAPAMDIVEALMRPPETTKATITTAQPTGALPAVEHWASRYFVPRALYDEQRDALLADQAEMNHQLARILQHLAKHEDIAPDSKNEARPPGSA